MAGLPRKERTTEYFQLKYSKKVVEFICDKIEEGLTLSEVCRDYGPPKGSLVPNEKSCYRWQKKYPEFKAAITEAYKTLLVRLIDQKLTLANRAMELSVEINHLENTYEENASGEVVKIKLVEDAIKKGKFELDAIKVKQRALEFILTRIAPKFVEDLKESATGHAPMQLPPITIVNYIDDNSLTKGNLLVGESEQLGLAHDKK